MMESYWWWKHQYLDQFTAEVQMTKGADKNAPEVIAMVVQCVIESSCHWCQAYLTLRTMLEFA